MKKRGFTLGFTVGFTIIELIIAISITGLVIAVALNVLAIFRKAAGQGVTIYTAQTDIRRSVTSVSDRLRNAAQVYILPEKFFNPDRTLPTDFSYIGVEIINGKKFLVNYVLKEDASGHDRKVIAEADVNATFRLELEKNGDDLAGIKILIDSPDGGKQEISTSIKSLNASHITDWSGGDEGICIAYSPDPDAGVKVKENPGSGGGAVVSFVLDCSGSMTSAIDTNENTAHNPIIIAPVGDSRAYYLRVAGKKFVEKLSEYDNVYLGVQGFNQTGLPYYHKELLNLSDSAAQTFYAELFDADAYLKGTNKYVDMLPAYSGTNIGDGLRIGYHTMVKEAAALGVEELNKFIALITDGEPNWTTRMNGAFYFGDTQITENPQIMEDNEEPVEYSVEVAKYIKNSGDVADAFIITLGHLAANTFQQIAQGFGIAQADFSTHIFPARNDIDFMLAIENISGSISFEVERSIGASLLEGIED
jgi:type II secretory pathway pseudopilin PulG